MQKGSAQPTAFVSATTVVWAVLIAATLVSWFVDERAIAPTHESTIVIAVAFFKIRLVGNHFMELQSAPFALRVIFEAYCFFLCAMILGIYFFAGA